MNQWNTSADPETRKRADQISGGVFLIGLAVLFMMGDFFPGILIVIGLTMLARGSALGQRWQQTPAALWLVGLGVLFTFGFSLPLLLIGIGVSMLFGFRGWDHHHGDGDDGELKTKNDLKRKHSDSAEASDVVVVGKSFQA